MLRVRVERRRKANETEERDDSQHSEAVRNTHRGVPKSLEDTETRTERVSHKIKLHVKKGGGGWEEGGGGGEERRRRRRDILP